MKKYREKRNADPVKRAAQLEKQRDDNLKRYYGIGVVEYEAQFEKQHGMCALCGVTQEEPLYVDHCHTTGAVRGLLCTQCNFGLGHFKDNIRVMARAIAYLEGGGVWNG